MAGRTGRHARRAPHRLLVLFILSVIAGEYGTESTYAAPSQKHILAAQMLKATLAAQRADLKMDDSLEALAKSLPALLRGRQKQVTFDPQSDLPLRQWLDARLGANPYDQEDDLKGEMQRIRVAWEANNPQMVTTSRPLGQTPGTRKAHPRVYFLPFQEGYFDFSRLSGYVANLEPTIVGTDNIPGTIYILMLPKNQFCLFSISLDGRPMHSAQKGLRAVTGSF